MDDKNLKDAERVLGIITVACREGDWMRARGQLAPLFDSLEKITAVGDIRIVSEKLHIAALTANSYPDPRMTGDKQPVMHALREYHKIFVQKEHAILRAPTYQSPTTH